MDRILEQNGVLPTGGTRCCIFVYLWQIPHCATFGIESVVNMKGQTDRTKEKEMKVNGR